MKEEETNHSVPYIGRLWPDEEILWQSQSEPMSLIKPLMAYLKICAVWGLILFAIALCIALFPPQVYARTNAAERNQELVDVFGNFLLVSLPVIFLAYGLYWWWTQYEAVAFYAVSNERVMMRQGRKTTAWKHDEIKKIDIVGDEYWASMTFTRVGGEMMTWHDIQTSGTILDLIRERVKTPIFVDHIQG